MTMPAGIEARIADILLTHLGTLTLAPAVPVSYPGIPFTPPSGTYLEATIHQNTTLDHFIGDDSTSEYRGLLQVSVRTPAGAGIIAPMDLAGKVAEHFKRGTVLSKDGLTVRVLKTPDIAGPLQEPDRLHVPVTVTWFCFA